MKLVVGLPPATRFIKNEQLNVRPAFVVIRVEAHIHLRRNVEGTAFAGWQIPYVQHQTVNLFSTRGVDQIAFSKAQLAWCGQLASHALGDLGAIIGNRDGQVNLITIRQMVRVRVHQPA